MFGLALAAFAATSVLTLGVVFGLGIFPLEGRTLVPSPASSSGTR